MCQEMSLIKGGFISERVLLWLQSPKKCTKSPSYTVATDELLCLKNDGTQCFSPQMNDWHPWQLKKKIKIVGAIFGAAS